MLRTALLTLVLSLAGACTSDATPTTSTAGTPSTPFSPTTTAIVSQTSQPPLASPPTLLGQPPFPTPHPGAAEWVAARVDAVIALYQPTEAGAAFLRSLDLRQMQGEPGFFGSYGFAKWAGVGEARPSGVIHELGHSYWGGFPVQGRPDLSWEEPPEGGPPTALASYHQDILAFMAQPPDDYELLRQRLRNLPGLSTKNTEPLFHSLEADLSYTTGGNLGLVPPILRKYWADYLQDGPLDTWYEAAGWFQSLDQDGRTTASKFLGFEHLDLREYEDLTASAPADAILPGRARILANEERQRLLDLAQQFDSLLGTAQQNEDFQFWRRYLIDKVSLHRSHPEYLASVDLPRAADLTAALDYLASRKTGAPTEQAEELTARLSAQPFLVNFLPAVDNQVLLALFTNRADLPQGPTLQATASFVERLERFGVTVDRVLLAARANGEDPANGAALLGRFISETGLDQEDDLRLFFDLFKDSDRNLAGQVVASLDKGVVRDLMAPVPFQLRALLTPEELLEKLDITPEAAKAQLERGVGLLIDEPSGNFQVDRPFLAHLFRVMSGRGQNNPEETSEIMEVMRDTPFPLEGFVVARPAAAARILAADLDLAVELIGGSDPVLAPPWRVLYRLFSVDPHLAARLVARFGQQGQETVVAETLAYLAYDHQRLARVPSLPISVTSDGWFLLALLDQQGEEWLTLQLGRSVELFRARKQSKEIDRGFLGAYQETLEQAVLALDEAGLANEADETSIGTLRRVIETVFGPDSG